MPWLYRCQKEKNGEIKIINMIKIKLKNLKENTFIICSVAVLSFVCLKYVTINSNMNVNTDLFYYIDLYNNLSISNLMILRYEKLFLIILLIFKYIGFNGYTALALMNICSFYLLFLSLKKIKFDSKILFVYLLYFIYPFCYDILQVRFFLAYSLSTFAMSCYMNDKKKIKFLILLLAAFFIHKIVIVYVLFLFTNNIGKQFGLLLSFSFSIILAYIFSMPKFYTNDMYSFLDLSIQTMTVNYFIVLLRQMIIIYCLYKSYIFLKKNGFVEQQYVNQVIKLNIFLLAFLVGFFVNRTGLDLFRIYRGLYFLDYVMIFYPVKFNNEMRKKYKVQSSQAIMLLLIVLLSINDYYSVLKLFLNIF